MEQQALNHFLGSVKAEMTAACDRMDHGAIDRAAQLILDSEQQGGRLHITGIGKPSHIAGYLASLLSSTGTPTYVLDGTEAVHGSCGQLRRGDVVIAISNSGTTAELLRTVEAAKNNGCLLIAVTGNPQSPLASASAVTLETKIGEEGGPLNRAPRNSILVQTLAVQALSVVLQAHKQITPEQYVRWHPGGALGKLREDER